MLGATAAARAQSQVTLGNAAVELTGPWKFHTGDNMRWADPGFDDSQWATTNLTPPLGSTDPYLGGVGFMPGWTARGYAGYSGYAWYRLRIDLHNYNAAEAGQPRNAKIALKMPDRLDDAYQIFVNGQFIGEFGRFAHGHVTAYYGQPRVFTLPNSAQEGPITIAIRMWMDASTPLSNVAAGGLHGPPVLAQASVADALLRLDWNTRDRSQASEFLQVAILLLAMLVAFGLYSLDRAEPAYLWLGLTCAPILLYHVVHLLGHYSTWISFPIGSLLLDAVFTPITIAFWVLFWAYWFHLNRKALLHRWVWGLAALLGASTATLRAPLYGRAVPAHAIVWLSPISETLNLLMAILLLGVAYRGIRKNRFEGWLALPAVLLVAASLYEQELLSMGIPVYFFPFDYRISIRQIGNILSLVIVTALLLRRFLRSQRERAQWKLEIEQARQVQSLLVPTHSPDTPGFAVESVYLPASSVGGDFFDVRPSRRGLLIVVGDVSGKGLKAAMTVSTIMGALHGCAASSPAEILTRLNGVLHGRVDGFATCIVALIADDSRMTIANAGHLPPYRNGEEMTVPGDLPLGILAESRYEEVSFQLASGDRLTFLSDGVLEARNAQGELYGFDRTREISRQPAELIARAAERFGQEDDITVLTVTLAPQEVLAI